MTKRQHKILYTFTKLHIGNVELIWMKETTKKNRTHVQYSQQQQKYPCQLWVQKPTQRCELSRFFLVETEKERASTQFFTQKCIHANVWVTHTNKSNGSNINISKDILVYCVSGCVESVSMNWTEQMSYLHD